MPQKRFFWTKIVLFLAFFLFLGGCSDKMTDPLPQLSKELRCHVSGLLAGASFEGTVTASAWETDEERVRGRALKLIFTAPDSHRGIVAEVAEGVVRLSLDGMEWEESALGGFLVPARLLGETFSVTRIETQKKDGKAVTVVFGSHPRGSREVTVDSASGQIVFVKGTFDGVYAEFSVSFSEQKKEG